MGARAVSAIGDRWVTGGVALEVYERWPLVVYRKNESGEVVAAVCGYAIHARETKAESTFEESDQ
jgi:hypothetical protein